MYGKRAGIRRFAIAAIVALMATVALLFLMTRLILPGEYHPVVTRVIRNVEFERTIPPLDEPHTPAAQIRQVIAAAPSLRQTDLSSIDTFPIESKDTGTDENIDKEGPARVFDWQREKRRLAQESDDEAFDRWLLEQGHERYVSIMQGPLPITNSVQAKLPTTQEDITGYMNVFGDKEIKISENCVATTQVAARFDQSDFAKALPMIITCRSRPKKKLDFDRRGRD